MRHTVRLAENARPLPDDGACTTTPMQPAPKSKPSNSRLRPLSELLG
jgi:hypothetical protein